jgi:hypothetical protein
MTKGVNPPKSKLFGIVACPKTGVAELSHPLDQSSQARCYLQLSPLLVNVWQEQMPIHPLRLDVHIN